ncbi:3-dehydroquinate synthase II family protein [Vallicoccus soli]|uniref:3-dehydroquinate synthase II family protein n=1 Tax=Vallicoccus soli TaxID=2339232 RepID=A0A3A3Z1Q5_9ACTN|nr:3-dehydroquinate synthase II family protein [Vallicoccus soli]RJK98189.1 3-dehydroquinate synthase II family protein [Vallicoccus soli]
MAPSRLCWLDVREAGASRPAVVEEALHAGIDGVVASDPADLEGLPPSVRRVLLPEQRRPGDATGPADVVVLRDPVDRADLQRERPDVETGVFIEVVDAESLERACQAARTERWTVLQFRDPTKIPLEIVIAAASGAQGTLVTTAADPAEARIVFGVLELGSDGVLMPGRAVGDATGLRAAAAANAGTLELEELTVVRTSDIGMGERACVDTCAYLAKDEGLLVGSHSKGMVLCVSETHPLPYMPTRPFRINAGAIHSYTLGAGGRTQYLSELRSGSTVTAVGADGRTREVPVGRVKMETRPLISVDAVSADGRPVNLILQHDWHVRVLGPGAEVLNSTELRPGHRLLGHLPTADRHVGYPIDEFCLEQ